MIIVSSGESIIVSSGESWEEQLLFTAQMATKHIAGKGQAKVVDWAHVERAVAQSEPPRIKDVPSHVKFLNKYGGGTSQSLMKETLNVLEKLMPEDRIINGTFFDSVAARKLPPNELMPRVIHSCLLLQATHKSERESVGCAITSSHIKSLAGNNKAKGMEAESILNKAHELANSIPEGASAMSTSVELGVLGIELVKFIFGLGSEFQSMQGVAKDFAAKWAGVQPAPAPEAEDVAVQNMFEFAPDGTNNAGMVTAQGAGFKAETLIEPKKNDSPDDIQYVIKYVNQDGSVGVHKVLVKGEEDTKIIVIKLDDLLSIKVSWVVPFSPGVVTFDAVLPLPPGLPKLLPQLLHCMFALQLPTQWSRSGTIAEFGSGRFVAFQW